MFTLKRDNVHLCGKYRIMQVKRSSSSKYYKDWQCGDVIELKFDIHKYMSNYYSSPPLTVCNLTKNQEFPCNHVLFHNINGYFDFEELDEC